MGKSDRILPPGPNPREDLLKEKDDRKLRDYLRQQVAEHGENAAPEHQAADQAEGERDHQPATKVAHTPGQAEGDRELTEEEIERREKGKQR